MTAPSELPNLARGQRKPPTHAPNAPPSQRVDHGSPNYFREWGNQGVPWEEIARLAVRTLRAVGVPEPDALEYYAWDDADRPLSLPALRLAPRKARKAAQPTQRARKSKRAPKADQVSPTVECIRKQLLAATRIFLADNRLQLDEDGEIPVRIGKARGFVQVFSERLVVRVFCQLTHDVAVSEPLLRRLHEVNASWWIARLILSGNSVFAAVDFPAEPFCVEHFTEACSALQAMEREFGDEMRGQSADALAKPV